MSCLIFDGTRVVQPCPANHAELMQERDFFIKWAKLPRTNRQWSGGKSSDQPVGFRQSVIMLLQALERDTQHNLS